MVLSNSIAQSGELLLSQSMMELTQSINSPVNNLSIFSGGYVPSILNGSWYNDQYGQIGTHNPEEFFTRLFQNKYEQAPSPVQIARGVEMLGGSTAAIDLNGTISSFGSSSRTFWKVLPWIIRS